MGYLKLLLTLGLLIIGLLHLPSININSLEGIFSLSWFVVGGLMVLGNYLYISKVEKRDQKKRVIRKRAMKKRGII